MIPNKIVLYLYDSSGMLGPLRTDVSIVNIFRNFVNWLINTAVIKN